MTLNSLQLPGQATVAPAEILELEIHFAERDVHTQFIVSAGETLALVGDNGSGKSTSLDSIAGWLAPDTGLITLGATTLFAREAGQRRPQSLIPAYRRPVGYLSQHSQLFPHLSVLGNVVYGMKRTKIPHGDRNDIAHQWLERVGIGPLAERKPSQLSGGQAQRAAIARMVASQPQIILLDEPLAAVDRPSAPGLRELLAEVAEGFTTVLVTHDDDDIAILADTVHDLSAQ